MAKDALAKIEPQTIGYLRSIWLRYQAAKWGWHVAVPVTASAVAAGILNWAWTMLSQDEYGAAMLLTSFFLLVGLGASLAILKKSLRVAAIMVVILITGFSGAVIWQKKGDKPWSSLVGLIKRHGSPAPPPQTATPSSSPSFAPSPSPTASPSPLPSASKSDKKLLGQPRRKKKPCSWKNTVLGKC
jgi:hypothetical protein